MYTVALRYIEHCCPKLLKTHLRVTLLQRSDLVPYYNENCKSSSFSNKVLDGINYTSYAHYNKWYCSLCVCDPYGIEAYT